VLIGVEDGGRFWGTDAKLREGPDRAARWGRGTIKWRKVEIKPL
jgi:hypothetical protein